MNVKDEKRDAEVQATADRLWDRQLSAREPVLQLEPYMVRELIRVMPDGVIMEICFDE